MTQVLVTGGTSGIGHAIAKRLVADGRSVIAAGRRATTMTGQPGTSHPGIDYQSLDLADDEQLEQRLNSFQRDNPNVSSLVLSSGAGRFGSLEEFSAQQVRDLVHLNLVANMLLVRAFLPQLRQHNDGHIVFIGSEAALVGTRQGTVYCASKFGLRGFAQALRSETSNCNLGVSIVNPGMVRTPFFDALTFEPGPDSQHAIEARDVADTVAMIFAMRPQTVVDEVNLSPRQHVIAKKPRR